MRSLRRRPQELELRERDAAVAKASEEVQAAYENRDRAEAAVLSLVPLNLKVSELRQRLARKEAQLGELQVWGLCAAGIWACSPWFVCVAHMKHEACLLRA